MKIIKLILLAIVFANAQSFITGVYSTSFKDKETSTWLWRPSVVIPAFKLRLSNEANTFADFLLCPQIGGGVTYSKIKKELNERGDTVIQRTISLSPATFLITNKSEDNNDLSLTYAITAAFFNDVIVTGFGWDLGQVDRLWQRPHLLLSFGVSIDKYIK